MKEFSSFLRFAEHLIVLGMQEKVLEHELLETACEQIEARAKEKIGTYQGKAGPFQAWPELAESTKTDRTNKGYPRMNRCSAKARCAID